MFSVHSAEEEINLRKNFNENNRILTFNIWRQIYKWMFIQIYFSSFSSPKFHWFAEPLLLPRHPYSSSSSSFSGFHSQATNLVTLINIEILKF